MGILVFQCKHVYRIYPEFIRKVLAKLKFKSF